MNRIYMDNAATTAVDPLVLETMLPYFREHYGNAASRTHPFGWVAEEAASIARKQIAGLLGANAKEIFVTSGATESDNLAIKGVAEAYQSKGRHLVTSLIEHPAVLDAARALEKRGFEVTYLGVDANGRIAPEGVGAALRPDTTLVSIIHGNNETGVVQDLAGIGEVCRARGVLFHTDATQSVGKIPIDVDELNVDLLSLSAHKIYGPKGVGALYARRRSPRVQLVSQLDGGGHQNGVRSGTLNVPGLVGLGRACDIARGSLQVEGERITALRDHLETALSSRLDGLILNSPRDGRLPGILNLSFEGLDGEALLLGLRSVALSSGSACASASLEPSHVLIALGRQPQEARSALRFSIGRFNTAEEVDLVIEEVVGVVTELRKVKASHGFPGKSAAAGESR